MHACRRAAVLPARYALGTPSVRPGYALGAPLGARNSNCGISLHVVQPDVIRPRELRVLRVLRALAVPWRSVTAVPRPRRPRRPAHCPRRRDGALRGGGTWAARAPRSDSRRPYWRANLVSAAGRRRSLPGGASGASSGSPQRAARRTARRQTRRWRATLPSIPRGFAAEPTCKRADRPARGQQQPDGRTPPKASDRTYRQNQTLSASSPTQSDKKNIFKNTRGAFGLVLTDSTTSKTFFFMFHVSSDAIQNDAL